MNRLQFSFKKTAIAAFCATTMTLLPFGFQQRNAQAQDPFADADALPLSLKLEELDGSWRKFSVSGQHDMADFMKAWTSLFGGIISYDNVYYTQGKTTTTAGQTYLVAYRVPLNTKDFDFTQFFSAWGGSQTNCDAISEFTDAPLTLQSDVSLALLNPQTIGSLNDIRPLDVAAEIQASTERQNILLETCKEQELRSVAVEAKQSLGSFHRAQQAYQLEMGAFTTNIDDLGTGIDPVGENYRYFMKLESPNFVSTQAIATSETGFNVVGGVALIENEGDDYTLSVVCEATEAGSEIPDPPVFNAALQMLSCPPDTTESYY